MGKLENQNIVSFKGKHGNLTFDEMKRVAFKCNASEIKVQNTYRKTN